MPSFARPPRRRDERHAPRSASGRRAIIAALCLAALCGGTAAAQPAQPPSAAQQAQRITQAQADLYERWRSNINLNQPLAFEAGRDYAAKYPEPSEYAERVRRWLAAYERAARKAEFTRLYKLQRFAELFRVGDQILADEPEHLPTCIHLAYAGYLAANKGDETFNEAAAAHARRAVLLVEGGRVSTEWQPFQDRADALGHLHFIVGELTLKADPEESVRLFRRAVEIGGTVKTTPVLYSRLAAAYVVGRYDPLSKDFQTRYAGKAATEESRAALAQINGVVDLVIDAYARAVALAGDDGRYADARRRWSDELTRFYKFRHNDTADGLEAFVSSVAAKPLPE